MKTNIKIEKRDSIIILLFFFLLLVFIPPPFCCRFVLVLPLRRTRSRRCRHARTSTDFSFAVRLILGGEVRTSERVSAYHEIWRGVFGPGPMEWMWHEQPAAASSSSNNGITAIEFCVSQAETMIFICNNIIIYVLFGIIQRHGQDARPGHDIACM